MESSPGFFFSIARYFEIKYDDLRRSRIVDIGFTVQSSLWRDSDNMFLGALHIHKGFAWEWAH